MTSSPGGRLCVGARGCARARRNRKRAPGATAESRRNHPAAMFNRPALDRAWRDHSGAELVIGLVRAVPPFDPTTPAGGQENSFARPAPDRRSPTARRYCPSLKLLNPKILETRKARESGQIGVAPNSKVATR